ncbi:MAG TPA: YciI family protein [Kribbella sp.]|jgi:hypothetical protein
MKYMLLIYGNQATWDALSEQGIDRVMATHYALIDELTASGELIEHSGLTVEAAQVVRVKDGVPVVTDGPFTEAKEVLAGYYLVDCDGPERAAQLAARLPEAAHSPIEIRLIP